MLNKHFEIFERTQFILDILDFKKKYHILQGHCFLRLEILHEKSIKLNSYTFSELHAYQIFLF